MSNILQYLEDSVGKYPEKTAVADKDNSYTFKDLESTAKTIAAHIEKNAAESKAVGVFVERSADTLAAFLAVVYSRRFYVPLDPEMPAKKLNMIIENAGIELILGNNAQKCLLDEAERNTAYLCIEEVKTSDIGISASVINAAGEISGDEPLFMVYTSGSTGVPKGVLKSHKAVISFIEAYVERFGFTCEEIIGNQTPFFFDASAKDIYLMLKTGATLEILPTEYFAMPPSLIKHMNDRRVSFISWVPSALSVIVQLNTFKAVIPETLKRVFFVGEVMPMKHLNKWREALPDLQYVNLYGSTEVAGISCCYEVDRTFENDENLPMGKPLGNCTVYLMDGDRQVTGPGQIGELFIVTDAAAICYYGDQEKTDKAFVYKDFGDGILRRAYRTGDLAQYDKDGNLLFASRSDFQIKHMGHRIELGEIETVAGAIEDIQRCACLYNEKKSRIVLFCQLVPESSLTDKDIKAILTGKLSSYMVPNRVNILETLPYNANNKIDRQKLKEML